MKIDGDIDKITEGGEASEELESSNSYYISIKDFDGPLDLLLEYVKREKIDIKDIFISDITEQYLAAMEQIDELDMEQAADFIIVASTLLEIKSKRLLPKPEEEEESEADDEEKDFIARLEAYKLFKEAAEKMREQEKLNMHYRAPDESVGQPRLVLKDMTANGLMSALRKLFDKIGARRQLNKVKTIARDPFTVEEKREFIRELFKKIETCTFDDLFDEDLTIGEVVTTFSALLELVKLQEVGVRQEDTFTPITIFKRRDGDVEN